MTTADRPRPTRALLDQREQQLADTSRELRSVQAEVAELRDLRDHLAQRTEPEAAAMALCVAALDEMHTELAEAERQRRNRPGMTTWATDPYQQPPPPPASATPAGRVLLYLAARYSVPLAELAPDAEPEPDGMDLVAAPSRLARKLERLVRDNPALLAELR